MLAIGDFRGQLDTAVDRSRGQQQQVVLGESQPFLGHHVELRVFGDRREQAPFLALELDPQDIDDVAARQDLVELVGDLAASRSHPLGTSVGGPHRMTLAPSLISP